MELNSETIKKLRGLIVFTVAAVVIGINYRRVLAIAGVGFHMLFPFILGAAIAFILNVPMRFIERHLRIRKANLKRVCSLILTIIGVAGILMLVCFVVTPQLLETFRILQGSIPVFFAGAQAWLEQIFASDPEVLAVIQTIQIDWQSLFSQVMGFLKNGAGSVLSGTISAAVSIVSGVTSFGIGVIFAVYILLQKENLGRQMRKLILAFFPDAAAKKIFQVAALTERTFSSFLTGQCLEAVILGVMFFVTLLALRLPFALLIGVLIAVTALIPIFGAFIGLALGAFFMLVTDPMDALVFTVTFFILQQIEGNLIYPHVVGGSVGLPSIWVLVAVTIGGNAFGIVGMLVFIPLCSVVYTLLREEVNGRLEKKRLAAKNPPKRKQNRG